MFTAGVLKATHAVCAQGVDMPWYYELHSDDKAAGYLSALTTPPHISVYRSSCLHSALSHKD